ncbi:DUF4232 domain-containing protein [Streptomyces sp. NPDC052682]|uniref:DUF4232 domain-containing protein n=1 Tax=Streptomyces sp. NPDC052682 TaxID=3154954 RepID=UPI003447D006
MRTPRTARPRTGLFAAATGITLVTLALTACQNGTEPRPAGEPKQSTASAPATRPAGADSPPPAGTPAETPKADSAGKRKPDGRSTGAGTGTGTAARDPHAPAGRVLCNGANTTVTAQPVRRPLNHLLLTVRNTGSKPCDLTYYPILRFDQMQWVPQPFKESKPQAVTTLGPGESGYAGVLLSAADGSGEGGLTGRRLTVGFQGTTPNSDGGPAATPPLPAKGVYYDSSMSVTYWQTSADDALAY